eukprot:3511391-Rhodomonas_salina.3
MLRRVRYSPSVCCYERARRCAVLTSRMLLPEGFGELKMAYLECRRVRGEADQALVEAVQEMTQVTCPIALRICGTEISYCATGCAARAPGHVPYHPTRILCDVRYCASVWSDGV